MGKLQPASEEKERKMERHFDELLADLKHSLVKMSALAETMICDAIAILVKKDGSILPNIAAKEDQVNELQVAIDEKCLTLIALHQPAASDLRFILGSAKTNTDLERLADQAVNISDKAVKLINEPPAKSFAIISRMAELARDMLRDSLHAYINRDVAKAREVLQRDDEVDGLKREVTTEMIEFISGNPGRAKYAMEIILIARNIERIGDHATNIAENIIFVVEGRDIRHHSEDNNA